jgi:hypothetical protein
VSGDSGVLVLRNISPTSTSSRLTDVSVEIPRLTTAESYNSVTILPQPSHLYRSRQVRSTDEVREHEAGPCVPQLLDTALAAAPDDLRTALSLSPRRRSCATATSLSWSCAMSPSDPGFPSRGVRPSRAEPRTPGTHRRVAQWCPVRRATSSGTAYVEHSRCCPPDLGCAQSGCSLFSEENCECFVRQAVWLVSEVSRQFEAGEFVG